MTTPTCIRIQPTLFLVLVLISLVPASVVVGLTFACVVVDLALAFVVVGSGHSRQSVVLLSNLLLGLGLLFSLALHSLAVAHSCRLAETVILITMAMDYFDVVLVGCEHVPLANEGQLQLLLEAAGGRLRLLLELALVLELVLYLCLFCF